MTERKINRGSEIRAKGKSMGRERSGVSADPSDRPSPQAGGLKAVPSAEGVQDTQDGLPPSTESAEGSAAALAERSLTLRAALFLTGRIALMLAGIAVMGLGIDIVVKADLGNSPISATPNVLSIGFTMVSFGTFMLGWQCFLVLVQIFAGNSAWWTCGRFPSRCSSACALTPSWRCSAPLRRRVMSPRGCGSPVAWPFSRWAL